MRLQISRFAASCALLAAVACGSATGPAAAPIVAGTYHLTLVGGQALPVPAGTESIVGGSMTLTLSGTSSGSYKEVWQYRDASGTVTDSTVDAGNWQMLREDPTKGEMLWCTHPGGSPIFNQEMWVHPDGTLVAPDSSVYQR